MRRLTQVLIGIGLVFCGACLGANVGGSAAPNSVWADDTKQEPNNVRYAQLFLKQSQLDLERVLDVNRRTPGSFQASVVDSLRQTVMLAESWLKDAEAQSKTKGYNPCLATAEALYKIAADDYNKIRQIQQRAPGSIVPTDIERAKVAVELAEVRLAEAKAIDVNAPNAVERWQIYQLREQVVELSTRAAKLEARN